MQIRSKVLILCLTFFSVPACVTTREQLNAEKGITSDGASGNSETPVANEVNAVKSEDITPHSVPQVIKKSDVTPPVSEEAPSHLPETAPAVASGAVAAHQSPAKTSTPAPDVSSYSADELRAEVARLSGHVEEVEHDKKQTEQSYAEEKKKNEERIAELEKKLKELQPDGPVVPEGKTPFEAGKDDYEAGKYDEAIVFLSQALAKSDTGKEAEAATYLRGESYYKKSQFNKAIVDFSHFPERYQKSSYHPKALLGIAESFEQMGRKEDAKAFYSDLLDKFPKTAEGKLAKKRLKAKK